MHDMVFEQDTTHTSVTPVSQSQGERVTTQQQQQQTHNTPLTPLTPSPSTKQETQSHIETVTGNNTKVENKTRKSEWLKNKAPVDYAKLNAGKSQTEEKINLAYNYILLGHE